ncbi:MFS transporter [Streptomyces sp. NPDC057445]|uniref:MFS transporter n=1 Tax=Streptomyces sp. NPDC057445 TaxID=3346136 RepID=UPI003680D754
MNTRAHRRTTLACSITGAAIVALDGTVLTVAQPTMQRELHASFTQIQWTSTGYLIAVASLLVFAGRLGDRFGHRRVFAAGTLGFAVTSAGIGLAPGVGWVIGLRVAQGVFGALLQPATLGMLRAAYPRDGIGRPIALRTIAIAVAAAAGPVIGGALTTHLGWRAVFFLNVAPAVAIGALALAVRVPAPRGPSTGLDLPGACLLAVALVCLVHTLADVPENGWTAASTGASAVAAAATAAFVRHERRTKSPLVPPEAVGRKAVACSLAVLLAASAAMFGALFVGTYFLQDVLGMNPLRSSFAALTGPAGIVLSASASAVALRRWGHRRTAVAAMVLLALGVFVLSRLDRAATPVAVGGGFLLLGVGFGTVMVTATAVIVHQASVHNAGVAGGLQQTAMNIGPALGIALATALMALTAPDGAGKGAYGGGPRWTGEAFTSSMSATLTALTALTALAAVAAAGALFALGLPRRLAPVEDHEAAEAGNTTVRDRSRGVSAK